MIQQRRKDMEIRYFSIKDLDTRVKLMLNCDLGQKKYQTATQLSMSS